MKKVKVSIVIPVYNATKYLAKCLDSVINQSYKDIEIVLVNDGSTDNSGQICDSYAKKDKRIIVFHQNNTGVSIARNNGINNSHGEYVIFIDSDDLIHPEYIQKLVNNVNNDILPVCQIEKFQSEVSFLNYNKEEVMELDKNHFVELCKMSLLNTPCCKLYDLDIIKKNKINFKPNLSLGEDLLFNLDYLKYINKIIVIKQKLYYYRKNEKSSLSSLYYANMFDIQILLFDNYTNFFKKVIMDKNMLYIYDSSRFDMIMEIVNNEFANGNVGFWQRYFSARKLLKKNELMTRIKDIAYPNKKLYYYLIRYKLLLLYRIVKKISE